METWKDIEGYIELYQVSNLGRVKNVHTSRVLKNILTKDGYYVVDLYKHKKGKKFLVHRLVAEAFIPNPNKKRFVDHINTIRTDNNVNNLRWVTCKENNNNIKTLKNLSKAKKGKRSNAAKRVKQYTKDGKYIKTFSSADEAQKILNISHHIGEVCNKKLKSCGGYFWKWE
jgi:hypothetical protein